jgi:4-diphosphocytidyl-2-C-methyl-D-erythritol kinase
VKTDGWTRALAPAKVNPWLVVRGRRDDGYHELDTGMLAIDLFDEVWARPRREPGLSLALGEGASSDVPADERNLAWRAASAVLESSGAEAGVELRLVKRIPSRAGLGGGSSDAAAAAVAVGAALGLSPSWEERAQQLAGIGSDCAFFAAAHASGFARCTGRGEQVEPLPAVPEHWRIALVLPDCGADTPAVYAALDPDLSRAAGPTNVPIGLFDLPEGDARQSLFAGLENAALASVPALRPWRELLDESGASHFRLSGSGSCFFGLFEDSELASRCLDSIETVAARRGMSPRGRWVTRPARHGVQLAGLR